MQSGKISNILNGIPCRLTGNQIMELGAQCSSSSFSLEKLIQISKTLYKNDAQSCYKFLQYIEKHEINRNIYKDFVHQPYKIQIYYSLAALALTKALKQNDKQLSQKLQKQFNKYLNLGSSVKSSAEKMYQLLHGYNSYYAGDFLKAISNFNRLDQTDKKQSSTIALIGLAQSHFMLRKYDKALEYYKKALIYNKNLPTKARLGMAYCFYQLEKYQLAQKCFQRILVLDPNSAQAYIGLAVINYRNNNTNKYFQNLKQAYKIKPNDPLVLLHLSEHQLFCGEYQKCQKLSRKGLQSLQNLPKFLKRQSTFHRDDYQSYKARFNNLIGQVYHVKGQYETAKKYYDLAKQRGLKFNDIALAQCLGQTGGYKQGLTVLQNIFTKIKPNQLKILAQFNKTMAYLQIKVQLKTQTQQTGPSHYFKQAIKYNKYDYDVLVQYSVYLSDIFDKKQTLKILQMAEKAIQVLHKQPKAELLNNLSVCFIEDQKIGEAEKMIDKALSILQSSTEEQLRHHALYLTVNFNKAIILQLNHRPYQAIQIHQKLLKYNRFYIDSYIKLAQILHSIGEKQKSYQLLDNAFNQFQKLKLLELRLDKLIVMKGHLQHIDNSPNQSRQTLKKLGKISMAYDQFYQMCMQYESLIKRQVDVPILKKFLYSSRKVTIQICQMDQFSVFSYMMLVILFVIDHKITKQQATLYFNQLKIAQLDFPIIQYNYGVYSLLNQDYDNAIDCFNRYNKKNRTHKADQYIALAYFLKQDYGKCIDAIKKNIINQPNNLKYRFQYALTHQKRVQKLYEEQKDYNDLKLSTKYLKISKKIFEFLAKVPSIDYIKSVDNPQLKQKIKNQIMKIRSSSQDRYRFVQSQLVWYANKQKQIIQKQRKLKQVQIQKIQQLKRTYANMFIKNMMDQDSDQLSSGQLRARQHKRSLDDLYNTSQKIATERAKEMDQVQKQQQELGGKKKKKNPQKKPRKAKTRPNQTQRAQQEQPQSEQQFKQSNKSDQQLNQYEQQDIEKPKKKKKKNKDRERQGDKKKRKKKKKQRKGSQQSQQQDKQQKSYKGQSQGNSQVGSNPFDDNKSQNQQAELRQREQPKKKEKKKKDDDGDDEIDIGDFMIN